MERHNGFTLVEVLVAMTMMTITMAGFYSVYRMQTRSLKGQENRLVAQQAARAALDFMVREIRNTGFNPSQATSGNNCGDGAPGNPGIIAATATSIHFSYDSNGNENCAEAGENIKYSFSNDDIFRTDAIGGGDQSLTGGTATDMVLKYFDQNGDPLNTFPLNATQLASIKRVNITVKVHSKNMDDEFGGALTAEMTTNVDLRNRGSL